MKVFITKLPFFALLTLIILIFSLSACTQNAEEQTVYLKLPSWPPKDAYSEKYPELCCWDICIHYGSSVKIYSAAAATACIQISPSLGVPAAVTAVPVTKQNFRFNACGAIFPFSSELTWSDGFSATILVQLYSTCLSNNNKCLDVQKFNWSKFSETLSTKKNTSEIFYNPWYCNRENILKGIIDQKFSTTLLNQKNCLCIKTEELNAFSEGTFLHPYIPQNHSAGINGLITIQKSKPEIFLNASEKPLTVIAECSDKEILSVTICEMPIQ